MPWYPDHYEHDDDPSEQYNSWDDMQDDYYEEELTSPGYSSDNPLAGYDPDRMWGGSDQISIIAMWEGDLSAEMYCYDKSFRLGGFPWDEGVRVHPSYYGIPGNAEIGDNLMLKIFLVVGVVMIAMIICSVT